MREKIWQPPRRALLILLLFPILALRVFGNGDAGEGGSLIGADAPAGKSYVYKHSAGEPRSMEVFFPPNHDPAKSRVPGLILFHGGNWVGGSLAQFRVACAYFASRGMVCATANYRMLPKAEAKKLPPGESMKRVCVTDAKSAIRWFKQHAKELGFDPARLLVGGASAGGHISALATLTPGLNDPADPKDIDTRAVACLWFNPAFSPDDASDPEIDVQRHLKADMPPTLVFFGDKDSWKKGWDAVHARMRSLGIGTVELQIAPGQSHGFFNKDPWQTVTLLAIDRFLARLGLLKGEPTKTVPASGEKLRIDGEAAQSPAATQKTKATTVEKITIAGKLVTIKVPDQPAPGKPWLWVGEFPGHMKSLEDGLVEKGWHVVHVGVGSQFGSPRAMEVWEKVYEEMHGKRGLSAKPALLGISRGGLYATAWTRLHPDRVSVLYLDNGVCDIRSWPAGFPLAKQGKGSPKDWKLCKAEFGYTSDAEAGEKAPKPCDGMLPAIQAGVLLISCHGTADSVVPYEDNAAHLVKMWQDNGGRLKLFPKEGADHHPHGLPDPAPIVEILVVEESADPSRAATQLNP